MTLFLGFLRFLNSTAGKYGTFIFIHMYICVCFRVHICIIYTIYAIENDFN